ncbi:D-alanyl-D-alanine carboxypeptidase/D-alanyl-D-alanine endopeptidase [Gordonia aichiensis]|uniref:D-alanyl-D-alanine carboxypeptidase n=1 Tax=Gordonia aichiensis NBRC 108223 TaxID=1220583 RepID=L7KGI6_9ACTN|nr:D-alanyl-D-alanine carboxypeptidase [Gordonia aichiensis NBRC 108223]
MGEGIQGGRLRGRRRAVVWTLVSVIVLALIASSVLFVALRANRSDDLPAGVPPRPAPIAAKPEISPVAANAPLPTADGVTKQISAASRAPQLGEFTGQVSDSLTGAILWSKGPNTPRVPASNTKILTAAAALLGLPHDARLTTSVVVGADGQVIVKGAGDPTLSAQPKRSQTFYTDPGRIADLADQIRKSGVPVTSVAVDTSAYSGPTMDSSWSKEDIAGGDIAPIESLMTDGARIDRLNEYSPRVNTPAITAGEQLAKSLDVDAPVRQATAPAGARTVASVRSAPLVTRVNDMLRYSDNVLAEALGIELSVAHGGPATLAGGTSAVKQTLADNKFDVSNVTLRDTSGLSYRNLVPAALLDRLMASASGPTGGDQPIDTKIRPMLDGLPVAGGTGTLADRFTVGENPGAGWVRAKTGTLTGVSSLTGIVQTVDGRVLSFALISGGTSPADARPALDTVAGKLRECGCR